MDEKSATTDQPPPAKTSRRRWFMLCLCTVMATITPFGICLGVISYWASQQRIVAKPISSHGADKQLAVEKQLDLLADSFGQIAPKRPSRPNWLQILLGIFDAPAERQRRAVAAIKVQGGYVEYDFERGQPISKWVPPPRPPGPDWLRNLIGFDYFATVYFVSNGNAEHISLSALPDFPHLTHVRLMNTVIDGGWEPLGHLTELQQLDLMGSNITDETLKHIESLTQLKTLYIGESSSSPPQVTDAGLENLKGLASLEQLYLQCCHQVTDAGLKRLVGLTRLQEINMSETRATADGIRQLQRALPHLRIVGP